MPSGLSMPRARRVSMCNCIHICAISRSTFAHSNAIAQIQIQIQIQNKLVTQRTGTSRPSCRGYSRWARARRHRRAVTRRGGIVPWLCERSPLWVVVHLSLCCVISTRVVAVRNFRNTTMRLSVPSRDRAHAAHSSTPTQGPYLRAYKQHAFSCPLK